MKPYRISLATVALILALSASACAGAGSQPGADEFSERNQSEHLSIVGAKDFGPTNFDNSTTVDNKWLPLEPGDHSVFEGSAFDDGQRISRRVVTTVTDLSKEIEGVNSMGKNICVPVDCYDDVLVIEEFERNKPGAFQLKYYASGVGDVRVGWRGPEEEEKEDLELVKDVRLGPQGMHKARAKALKMEKHAYQIKDYYRKTQPAKPTL